MVANSSMCGSEISKTHIVYRPMFRMRFSCFHDFTNRRPSTSIYMAFTPTFSGVRIHHSFTKCLLGSPFFNSLNKELNKISNPLIII